MKKKKALLVSGALAVAGMLVAVMVATLFISSPVGPSTEPPETGGGGTTPPQSGDDGTGGSSPPTSPPGLGGAVPPLKWGLKDPTHVDSANAKAQAVRLSTEATASGILEKIGLGFVFHVPNGHSSS